LFLFLKCIRNPCALSHYDSLLIAENGPLVLP
jgi:hypothetical protein